MSEINGKTYCSVCTFLFIYSIQSVEQSSFELNCREDVDHSNLI